MPSIRWSRRPAALRHGTGLSATRKLHDADIDPKTISKESETMPEIGLIQP
jgi:hypothetical protein